MYVGTVVLRCAVRVRFEDTDVGVTDTVRAPHTLTEKNHIKRAPRSEVLSNPLWSLLAAITDASPWQVK
jgi:hypothetical protein